MSVHVHAVRDRTASRGLLPCIFSIAGSRLYELARNYAEPPCNSTSDCGLVEPKVVMEMASNETIKQAVMAGMGLSFLSLHTVGLELDNKIIAVLDVEGYPHSARVELRARPVQTAFPGGRGLPVLCAGTWRRLHGRTIRTVHVHAASRPPRIAATRQVKRRWYILHR